jgi:hypothetical protein
VKHGLPRTRRHGASGTAKAAGRFALFTTAITLDRRSTAEVHSPRRALQIEFWCCFYGAAWNVYTHSEALADWCYDVQVTCTAT